MKLSISLLITALLSTSTLLHAEMDTPLEKQMQALARGTKQLSIQVADQTKQKETITLVESLKKTASDSRAFEPRKTTTIAQADRIQFLDAFRAQLQKLADTYGEIEDAVKSGQYDKAKSLLGTLQGIKKEGHSKFKQD